MNCLDFRREILVNPRAPTEHAQRHARDCAACEDFQARATALDEEIATVLEVCVPEGLEERILQAAFSGRRDARRRFLAMAASLAGVAVAGTGAFIATRDDPAALAGIDFVVEEETNAILTAKAPDRAELFRAVQKLGLDLPDQIGEIRYIGTCPFQGTIAHHVIVTTPQGKATLLLLPDKPLERRGAASARGLRSIIRPAGRGSAAVIAESSRGLERIEQMVWMS